MTTYTPRTEQKTGTDLTGLDAAADRTYTLANDDAILAHMQIIIDKAILQPVTDFTLNTTTNIITFLNKVWNTQVLSIHYWTEDSDGLPGTSTAYTTTLDIIRKSGIGIEEFGESLGTGDGTEDSYDLAHNNIIDGSYSLYYTVVGDNSTNALAESTHYTIDKDRGLILLTSAGKTAINTKALYIDYVYGPKHSNTILDSYIAPASAEVELLTGNFWGTATTQTEYFDGYSSGYPYTERPFGNDLSDYDYPEFQMKYKGINSITSVEFLDFNGDVNTTVDSDNINYEDDGRLLLNTTIPNGKKNVKVTYISGYATVPVLVQELASLVGGIMALVNISGGSYRDISSYQIGRKNVSLGEVHANISGTVRQLNARIKTILDLLGRNYACC